MDTSSEAALHAIILAAGGSSRFGSPKQLALIDGQALILRVIKIATEVVGGNVTLVLGAHADEIAEILPCSLARVFVNRVWKQGIAGSIRAGIERLPHTCAAVFLLVADQPLLSSLDLTHLAIAWRRQPHRIVASRYSQVTGVPAIFPYWCFKELMALRGDQGARVILSRYPDQVVPVANPAAQFDIDCPQDLVELGVGRMR